MPIIVHHAGGWGCNCPAFRARVPNHYLVDTISRASMVMVEKEWGAPTNVGMHVWRAWTNSESVYTVIYDPDASGGWCKHIVACAADLVGGQLGETYHSVKEMNEECHELQKENKKLKRMLETAQRKAKIAQTGPVAL